MGERINFTKAEINGLAIPPKGKRFFYYDIKTKGLVVQVTSIGTKTFYVYRWVDGKPERVRLGEFPDITIDQARRRCVEVNGDIARGENPNDKRRALREQMTLGDLYQKYLGDHIRAQGKSERTLASAWRKHLSPWTRRKLSALTRTDVQGLRTRLLKGGMSNAGVNRITAIIKAMFNWANSQDLFAGENPCQGIKRLPAISRERFLQEDELPRFFHALADEPNTTARDYILMSLLTGARRANVLAMRWDEINFERRTWTIPMTKSGDPHTLPLMSEALAILEIRKATKDDSPWVFPGSGATGHLVEPKKAWARILKRADIAIGMKTPDGAVLHDLRRSLGSWQAATGASLSIIGKTLGHRNVSTTAIYARLNQDPVRAAMETATQAMLEAAGLAKKTGGVELDNNAQ
jgi:integrase